LTTKTINIISTYVLAFSAIAFLLFYFILSFNNRAASDDIVFTATVKNEGVALALTKIYNLWSGRWASWGYLFILLSASENFQNLHYFLFIYHCITIIILVYSVNTIISICIKKLFNTTIHSARVLIYSILFIAGFYYSTFNHIEVWWWISASVYYFQGIVFFLFGFALLLKEQKNILQYIFIVVSFLYVGASFELYILTFGALSGLISLYFYFKNRTMWIKIKNSNYFNGIRIAVLCFVLSACVCFIAPGNYDRQDLFTELADNPSLNMNILFQSKYVVYVIISMLFILLGKEIKSNKEKVRINMKTILLFASVPFVLSIIINVLFQFFVLNGNAIPLRGWTFTSFSFHCFLSIVFMYIGYMFSFEKTVLKLASQILVPCFVLTTLLYATYKQYNYVSNYSAAYDKQLTDLMNAKKKGEKVVYVTPLPNSGMLVYLYMDEYTAVPLAKLLNLDFEIKLKD